MNLTDPLRALARERPDTVAYVRPRGGKVSLRAFDRQVDDLARRCLDLGVVPGEIVMLAVRRPLRLLQLELALARIGAAAASPSIDRALVNRRFIEGEAPASIRPDQHFIDSWFETPPREGQGEGVPSHRDPNATAIVAPSSGTTGEPKSIPLTHAQVAARLDMANQGVPLPHAPRIICATLPSSAGGFVTLLRVLNAGGTIVSATTAEEIVAAVERFHVNCIRMTTTWIERLVAALPERGRPLAALEVIEVGGTALSPTLHRLARERLCERIVSVYVATETGLIASGLADELDLDHGSVGRVVPGIEVEAFDATGAVLPRGSDGLLRARGPSCADGYLGQPDASDETFRDGWVALPDVGRVGADGSILLGARASEAINVGGHRVNPGMIESALLRLDLVEDAAAFGAVDGNGSMQLCAAIVVSGSLDRATLDTRLREQLGRLTPSLVLRVKSIPRNEDGTIQRNELVSLARAAGVAPAH